MIDNIVEKVQSLFGSRSIRKKPRVLSREESGIQDEKVNSFSVSVCDRLQDAGYKAYIVGGAVRDMLIGRTPKDFDVATDATPEQVKKLTRRAIIIGRRFRLVHVIKGADTIEVSTFRGLNEDGVEKDAHGRVIDDNVFGEQYEDAARRDFTVNAMYYDPATGEVLDYHNGMLDIRKKRIRMIGDPQMRYQEDPVRILRAIRIAAKLGFSIDPKTAAPMGKMQVFLNDVPVARLFDEMLKMLMSGASLACVDLLEKYKIRLNLPVFDAMMAAKDNVFVRKALERCDARVQNGKSVSTSFLFAVLMWDQMKKTIAALPKDWGPAQLWSTAASDVSESRELSGVQRRYINDMQDIWRLQPKFERRTGKNPLRLLEHPRFRAAYDFLLIRASAGEVPHELADWWTAFEAAPDDEKFEMVREAEKKARSSRGSRPAEGAQPSERKRPLRRKKSSSKRSALGSSEPAEVSAPAAQASLSSAPAAAGRAREPAPQIQSAPAASLNSGHESPAESETAPKSSTPRRRGPRKSALLTPRKK